MSLSYQYKYLKSLLKRYGVRGLITKALERKNSPMLAYTKSCGRYFPTEEELLRQKENQPSFSPLVSIVVPAYETPKQYLKELIESVLAQSYENFELCIADGSRTETVEKTAAWYAAKDGRIRWKKLEKNGGISENTNGGFAMAKGEYIALMDHDDRLSFHALYEMVQCLNDSFTEEERKMALIYSDEDKMNRDGTVFSRPHFKPDFNLEFLRRNNYFCHFLMFSSHLLDRAGGLKKEYDGAQDYDFVLRCVDAGAVVRHVPKILYHWRIHEGSTAGNSADKAYAFDSGCRAIEAHLKRCMEPGRAEVTANLGVYRVRYELKGRYKITVAAEADEQLCSIRKHYQRLVEKGDAYHLDIQYRKIDFGNHGIEKGCTGDYILYIRQGIRVNPNGLIESMLGICQRRSVGIVGAKIITKNRRVASCGFCYGKDGSLIPLCGGIPASYKGYFLHAVIPQNVSAVSFGCVMFRKDAFQKAGGMDLSMTGIYRDADCCFRFALCGYDTAVTPEVLAVEYEADLAEENEENQKQRFLDRWEEKLMQPDPCYNRNLSLAAGCTYAMKRHQPDFL